MSMSDSPVQHLPKVIDESGNRHHYYETLWKRVALDLLRTRAGPVAGWSLLDYGSGRGETLRLAAGMGMVPTGTDLDPDCVVLSRGSGESVLLTEPDDPARQFGVRSFDVVSCFHVLEHVARPREVLTALGLIARRFVVVAVPNLRVLPPGPMRLRKEPPPVNDGHLQSWDHAHFRNLAERHCGLRVVAWGFDHCKLPVIGELAFRLFGNRAAIALEAGLGRRLFPYHATSVIALLEPMAGPTTAV